MVQFSSDCEFKDKEAVKQEFIETYQTGYSVTDHSEYDFPCLRIDEVITIMEEMTVKGE